MCVYLHYIQIHSYIHNIKLQSTVSCCEHLNFKMPFCCLLYLNGTLIQKSVEVQLFLCFSFAFASILPQKTRIYPYTQTLSLLQTKNNMHCEQRLCLHNFFLYCVNHFFFCRGFHSNNIKSIPERAFVGNPSLITM